jgi:hypothetical protein
MQITMNTTQITQPSIQQVIDRIMTTRRITRLDQHLLLMVQQMTLEEKNLVNQVFDRLRQGLLKVVD